MSEEKCQAIKNVFFFSSLLLLCFGFAPRPGSRSTFKPRRGLNAVKIFTFRCLMKLLRSGLPDFGETLK